MAANKQPGAEQFLPNRSTLRSLRRAAEDCKGCELYRRATQTVFGAGPARANLALIGEQPGDSEDTEGAPFVGPAGRVLDRALADAGIARAEVYLTNAVKHFRWKSTDRGPRRIHDKPAAAHVNACRPWVAAELAAVRPRVLVALGATAAACLFGSGFRLSHHRGELIDWPPERGPFAGNTAPVKVVLTTVHPSAVLRADNQGREDTYRGLVSDLGAARQALTAWRRE